MGLGPVAVDTNLIEGAETRRLESLNASMTTASESIGYAEPTQEAALGNGQDDDEMKIVDTNIQNKNMPLRQGGSLANIITDEVSENLMGDFSMVDAMDQQLLKNIEQYVLQNMSRGQINLEEMANAMGMGRVPFFHKVRALTNKTPAELVRDLRLKHSCILLKRTNINMSELATNVGFLTAENFIKVFKEKFGLSPLEYRLKHRK